ncbi:hypothetical protein N0V83_007597 [Neocucurbitaria cava]|uniref:Uncharacterized protein n=1 Tax=Neocucurbitaria cava TaxID=798079 RepID=A0A9W8Y4Z3_9PLEO|nr:hypothetical protein N0V83_007597 [Neocucurbitaria cava]
MPKTPPRVSPIVSLVIQSDLTTYTHQSVKDYLRLNSDECQGLRSDAMRDKTRFVLRELKKLGKLQEIETRTPSTNDEDYRAVDQTPMHWEHPIPFLFNCDLQDPECYTPMGRAISDVHPGEPEHGAFYDSVSLPFDHAAIHAYDRRSDQFVQPNKIEDVVEVTRQLYRLNPAFPRVFGERYTRENLALHGRTCKDKSVAVIARAFLSAEHEPSFPYSKVELLAQKILDVYRPVLFEGDVPALPFSVVRLQSFSFVDYPAHINCEIPQHLGVDAPCIDDADSYDEEYEDMVEDSDNIVQESARYILWLIDVEFGQVKGHNAIPYQVVVRDGSTGRIVVSSLVDYSSMSLQDLSNEVDRFNKGRKSSFTSVSFMARHYRSDFTRGLSLATIGQILRNAGFNPDTHRILSWYSHVDIVTFGRAIYGDNNPISKTNAAKFRYLRDSNADDCFQPIQLGYLIKHCTDLRSGQLGFVHRSLCPGRQLVMHDAENDTLAMYEVYQQFLSRTREFV